MGRSNGPIIDPDEITRDFERVRRGYDPAAVDHHLALIKTKVKALLAMGVREPDESYDLVMKATKKSIDEALVESRSRAAGIVSEAETAAEQLRAEAEIERFRIEEQSRERYVEMGRLTDQREADVAALDAQLKERQGLVRSIAADLERLAGSIDGAPAVTSAPVAAQRDGGIEIVVPVERGDEA